MRIYLCYFFKLLNLRRPEEQNPKEQEENKTGPEDFINIVVLRAFFKPRSRDPEFKTLRRTSPLSARHTTGVDALTD